MLNRASLALAALFLSVWGFPSGAAAAPSCAIDRPVMFGGLDWDSNAFHTELARLIIERGYGCETDVLPGSTLPLVTGLGQGDIDVLMEIWRDNVTEPWNEALEAGTVVSLGTNFPDAVQGWYVPRYVIEGDAARGIEPMAPDLRSVSDLKQHAALFRDPEQPGKGRFYNCILGWSCEEQSTRKLEGYGLDRFYTNFRPGTGAALAAAIASAYERGEPVVAYYWGPTWVLGTYDLVKLEEPPYSEEAWNAFNADPKRNPPVAFPTVEVIIGANARFAERAPEITAFLRAYETTGQMTSEALAYMQANSEASARDAALHFIETRPDIWRQWVTPEIAARVTGEREAEARSFPVALEFPVEAWVNRAMKNFVADYGNAFHAASGWLLALIVALEAGLGALPWWLIILAVAGAAWHASRHFALPVILAGLLFLIGTLGLWDLAIQTLALMLVSVFFAVLIGLPSGIAIAASDIARRIVLPVLDAMQTLPSFVYLIPALMLFGLGKVPALFATVIYATPPLIRLVDLGLRTVDRQLVEMAADLGADKWRQLIDIKLPLALPSIMAGVNQTTMMALSMVVIASMIGARGLGEEVLLGIQRLDIGRGLAAGIAIVALAIVFDRITQAYGRVNRKDAPPGR
ncbi:Substrate-binding region of ABC-type glycine betaine transport system [Parvibaculum lavamentivorans DS-1]|uniref:Substrate-binding region of ABC-type glycine betaine transport system n=2 Tax=Parvibaculum lavamentivorans TaxID=256618 RepID=A7HS05_PARL1|nr:glycine betaine ABC transporter substrate-binding protein [Parvibaculum lavamentivorans]ABS62688.1 Substrate-binding region of ABC-type glycine betaine transport system [Parvibaculum lavamentivorans DS-1]